MKHDRDLRKKENKKKAITFGLANKKEGIPVEERIKLRQSKKKLIKKLEKKSWLKTLFNI